MTGTRRVVMSNNEARRVLDMCLGIYRDPFFTCLCTCDVAKRGDSDRIQQLEAENKHLREAVGAKGKDDDVDSRIAALEQEIARHL